MHIIYKTYVWSEDTNLCIIFYPNINVFVCQITVAPMLIWVADTTLFAKLPPTLNVHTIDQWSGVLYLHVITFFYEFIQATKHLDAVYRSGLVRSFIYTKETL